MASGAGMLLNSGHTMPIIGLGVWRMQKNLIRDLIFSSIKLGYRHFDCAGSFRISISVTQNALAFFIF